MPSERDYRLYLGRPPARCVPVPRAHPVLPNRFPSGVGPRPAALVLGRKPTLRGLTRGNVAGRLRYRQPSTVSHVSALPKGGLRADPPNAWIQCRCPVCQHARDTANRKSSATKAGSDHAESGSRTSRPADSSSTCSALTGAVLPNCLPSPKGARLRRFRRQVHSGFVVGTPLSFRQTPLVSPDYREAATPAAVSLGAHRGGTRSISAPK
jgi:hypothetical protein